MTNIENYGHYRNPKDLLEYEKKNSLTINAAYARAALDREPIVVEPSDKPKAVDEAHEANLAAARQRIGHLTGPIAVRQSREA